MHRGMHAHGLIARARARTALVALAAAGLAGIGLTSHSSAATLGVYSASISPTTTVPNQAQQYTLTITNQSPPSSLLVLGAANVAIPPAFAVTSVGLPTASNGQAWTATVSAQQLQLRASTPAGSLLPGQSVSAAVTARTASSAFGFYPWNTQAAATDNFGDPGQLYTYQGSQQPTVQVGQQASVVDCPPGQPCDSGTLTSQRASVDVHANAAPSNDVLTTAIGGLAPMSCTRSGDVARFTVQDRSKTITYRIFGEYEEGLAICYGSATDFRQANGTLAPLVNGEYEGLLPTCSQSRGTAPCVQSQSDPETTEALDSVILAPSGDPGVSGH